LVIFNFFVAPALFSSRNSETRLRSCFFFIISPPFLLPIVPKQVYVLFFGNFLFFCAPALMMIPKRVAFHMRPIFFLIPFLFEAFFFGASHLTFFVSAVFFRS
jgi:hypothetical protein